jgi:diguanylate cyclase (GGDEF)-like protein/PAS domain S-box-containing protein
MRVDELSPITGEFILEEPERSFRAERLPAIIGQARILFVVAALANFLYFFSEWRFQDHSFFYTSLSVRCFVIAVSLAAIYSISQVRSFKKAELVIFAWALVTCPAVGVLIASHSNTALFVSIMLPSVCWLLLPISFRMVAGAGVFCSVVTSASYGFDESDRVAVFGLALVMLILNAALAAAVLRSNRLSRQQWIASQRERRAREELAESRHALQRMLMCVPVPLLIVSKADGKLIHANDAAVEFLGGHPEDIGMRFLSDLRADVSQPVRSLDATENAPQRFEGVIRVADGSARDVLVAARVLKIDGVESVLVAGIDITDRKLLERRLAHLATTDSLTGIANRAGFFDAAHRELAASARCEKPHALLMIDMDHFKLINDTFGHETGDVVLRSFARLCRRQFRARDIVGRLGGEEFAILIPHAGLEAALARAEKLRAGAEKLRFRGRAAELRVTASIGVTCLLSGETTIDAALSRADKALYGAKRNGRNRVSQAEETSAMSKVA